MSKRSPIFFKRLKFIVGPFRLGRIPAIILIHLIAGAAGCLTPFSEQRLPLFMFLRFLLGFVYMSQGSIAYVLGKDAD